MRLVQQYLQDPTRHADHLPPLEDQGQSHCHLPGKYPGGRPREVPRIEVEVGRTDEFIDERLGAATKFPKASKSKDPYSIGMLSYVRVSKKDTVTGKRKAGSIQPSIKAVVQNFYQTESQNGSSFCVLEANK